MQDKSRVDGQRGDVGPLDVDASLALVAGRCGSTVVLMIVLIEGFDACATEDGSGGAEVEVGDADRGEEGGAGGVQTGGEGGAEGEAVIGEGVGADVREGLSGELVEPGEGFGGVNRGERGG